MTLIGRSAAVKKIRAFIKRAAGSDFPVLLTGETGVGKDLVARMVHEQSKRKGKPFLAFNCSSIPDTLVESELFGYKRGAFTDARENRAGLLEKADGGSVFFDEIGESSKFFQSKLLRAIDNQEVKKLGENRITKVDLRYIFASNRNISEEVNSGGFRRDLYHRINVLELEIPPLRERSEDIPLLIDYFCKKNIKKDARAEKEIFINALGELSSYSFPGNIRELENLIKRLSVVSNEDEFNELILLVNKEYTDRRRSIPKQLFTEMKFDGKDFWEAVRKPFLNRDLNRREVREIVRLGMEESGGHYKRLLALFNLSEEREEYKKFVDFLRTHKVR